MRPLSFFFRPLFRQDEVAGQAAKTIGDLAELGAYGQGALTTRRKHHGISGDSI